MAKPGRNDRCPCGSGKKYKACCLTRDEAAERQELAKAQAARDERTAEHRQSLREVRETMLARLAGDEGPYDDDDALMDASNAVIDLVHAGKLDEAEKAARQLLVDYPDVVDGHDRLGMVYDARGDKKPDFGRFTGVMPEACPLHDAEPLIALLRFLGPITGGAKGQAR